MAPSNHISIVKSSTSLARVRLLADAPTIAIARGWNNGRKRAAMRAVLASSAIACAVVEDESRVNCNGAIARHDDWIEIDLAQPGRLLDQQSPTAADRDQDARQR